MGEYIKKNINYKIICGNCSEELNAKNLGNIDLTFLDPPFNQDKEYTNHNDNLPEEVSSGISIQILKAIKNMENLINHERL